MLDDVLAQPHQIGDALWRVEAASLPPACCRGPGGLRDGRLGDRRRPRRGRDRRPRHGPLRTVRGYAPEPRLARTRSCSAPATPAITEETLACFEAAGAAGAPRVALTTGGALAERAREEGVPVIGVPSGMQPRAAVVYMTVGALECAAAAGAAPSLRDEIEGAREVLEALAEDPEPAGVAGALLDTIPVVHGAGLTAPVARRWKTQLNENAKVAAFASELPEANHNEIEGWEHGRELAPLSAVFLRATPALHARIERRIELSADTLERLGAPVARVDARGDTPVAAVLVAGDARRPGRASAWPS